MFTLSNQFLSQDVYKAFQDKENFLYELGKLFDWGKMGASLWDLAANAQGGRPRWNPVLMLKMLFVAFLYDRSDREMEELATYDIRVKQFLGLPIDGRAPDHTSLCRFREETLTRLGATFFDRMFEEVLEEAKQQGITFGRVYAIDATHVGSSVNGKTDTHEVNTTGIASKDPEASWGNKGFETKLSKDGKKVQVGKYFFGYKVHGLCETTRGLVTGLSVTTGRVSDLDAADTLVHRALTPEQRHAIDVLTADKGYGCPVFINELEKHTGIMTAFHLPQTMTKRGEHQDKWQAYMANEGRTAFRRERPIIERVFGDTKNNHGLKRARYKGLSKLHLQATLAMVAHNVKIILRQVTGVRLQRV